MKRVTTVRDNNGNDEDDNNDNVNDDSNGNNNEARDCVL